MPHDHLRKYIQAANKPLGVPAMQVWQTVTTNSTHPQQYASTTGSTVAQSAPYVTNVAWQATTGAYTTANTSTFFYGQASSASGWENYWRRHPRTAFCDLTPEQREYYKKVTPNAEGRHYFLDHQGGVLHSEPVPEILEL